MGDQNLDIVIRFLQQGDTSSAKKALDEITKSAESATVATQKLTQAKKEGLTNEEAWAKAAARSKPPVIQEQEHGGTTARRHFGAVAGQILGMPGLGMLAAAGGLTAGVGIIVSLMEKAAHVAMAWSDAIQQVIASSRGFETYEQRVDSLALRTQNLRQHNDAVALSYNQIEKSVNNTANAVSNYLDLLQTQAGMNARVEDAQLRATLARINLEQRFNPIERIRQTEAAEEEAYQRRLAREKKDEQDKLAALALQEKLASARKAFNEAQLAEVNAVLPERQHAADLAADELTNVEKQTDARQEKLEAERAIVKQMAEGSITPGAGLSGYKDARAKLLPTEGFTGLDKTIAANPAALASLTLGAVPADVQVAAKRRLAEIDKAESEDADKRTVARAKARATAHEAKQLEGQQSIYEKGREDAETKRQEALRDAGQLRQKIQIENPARATEESETIKAMRQQRDLQIQQSMPSVKLSAVQPTGGDPQMERNNQLLERILQVWEATA